MIFTTLEDIDSYCWRRLCISCKVASNNLCHALATYARRLCTQYVHPTLLSPLLACWLIALGKLPGVRLISVGETVCWIIARAILSTLKYDILDTIGVKQLCAGKVVGVEFSVHLVQHQFQHSEAVFHQTPSTPLTVQLQCIIFHRYIKTWITPNS